jgi:hypothetical protein
VKPSPFTPEWTAPLPPGGPDRPIRAWRVAAGTLLALLGHVPTAWLTVAVARMIGGTFLEGGSFWVLLLPLVQVPLMVLCVVPGVLLLRFGDRGFGLGLLAGWAAGVVATVVVGFGVLVLFGGF